MRTLERSAWVVVALAASLLACEGSDAGGDCAPGSEVCACYPNRTCDSGLICSGSDICVKDDDGSGGTDNSDAGGSSGSSDSGGSGGSDGGSSNSGGSEGSGASGGSNASGSGGSSGDAGNSSEASNDAGGASTRGADSTNSAGGATSSSNGGAGGTAGTGGESGGAGGSTSTTSGGAGGTTTGTTTAGGSGGSTGETRTALVPVDGWVDGSTNDVGIQGSWYTYGDDLATVVPADEPFFDGMGSEICISGTTVPDEYSGVYWGVAVGMDFNVVDDTAYAYDATLNGVVGIRLTLTGSLPPGIQLNLTETTSVEGDTFCTRYTGITESSRTLSLYFDEAQFICWYGATFGPIDETLLKTFSVQVLSAAYESIPFDFCVENVSAIVE